MYLNCGTVALTHLIMPLADTHLSQVFTSKEDLNFYPSLYHYCNDVTHRQIFHVSLLSYVNVSKKEIKKIEDNINTHPVFFHQHQHKTSLRITTSATTRPPGQGETNLLMGSYHRELNLSLFLQQRPQAD